MKIMSRCLPLVLAASSLWVSGCVSHSQSFIGPSGDVKVCSGNSQSQGLGGVILAGSRFNGCVDDVKAHGYVELERVGSIGIALYTADADGLVVRKVYDNSPAAKVGIVRGDKIVSINGKKTVQNGDFDVAIGEIGAPVTVTINRNDKEKTYTLLRAKLAYSRVLEDVSY
jgi:membrane-associated protease RseP (regulator of RpoE activity)